MLKLRGVYFMFLAEFFNCIFVTSLPAGMREMLIEVANEFLIAGTNTSLGYKYLAYLNFRR